VIELGGSPRCEAALLAPRGVEAALPLFKALADPTRLRLVALLAASGRCVCELQRELDVPPPLLSHHLKTLREAGIIAGTRRGRWIDYRLEGDALAALAATFAALAPAAAPGVPRPSVDAPEAVTWAR